MEKVVQTLRKKIDGVSELFTRHGGMTVLEEAELTEARTVRSPDTRPRRPRG